MTTAATHIAIFEWITGKRRALATNLQESAVEFAKRHRLVNLALQRALEGQDISGGPLQELRGAQQAIETRESQILALARDARRAAAACGSRVLVVKGVMAAAITGNRALRHMCADLDVLPEDAEAFAGAMLALGYRRAEREDRHEIVLMSPEGRLLDAHRYWPIRRRPGRLQSLGELAPLQTSEVSHGQLARGLVSGRLPGTEALSFPAPEVAALLCLTASARDIIWEPFGPRSSRLYHFTDAYHLLDAELMNWDRFDALARELELEVEVATARELFERYFPANPLSRSKLALPEQSSLLLQLMNGPSGLWHWEALESVYFASFEERVARLGLTGLGDGETRRHRCQGDSSFSRVYEASNTTRPPSLRSVRAIYQPDSIVLRVHVEKRAERGDSVLVQTSATYCHWHHEAAAWGTLPKAVEYTPSSFTLDVTLPGDLRGKPALVGLECSSGADKVVTAFPVSL